MRNTVENTRRSPIAIRGKIIPLTTLLATLTLFFSVVGLMGLTIFGESFAKAETEATRPAELTPAAFKEPSEIAAQSEQVTDKNIQTIEAVDEIDLVGEQLTRVADSSPAVVAHKREGNLTVIDLDALQRVKAADWLLRKNPQHYLIQLSSGTDYNQMNNSAYAVAQALEVDPTQGIVVYPFKSNNKGQTVYGFGIGPYRNATAARNAISEVPQDVKQNGTWIRRLDDLQSAVAEINSTETGNLPNPEPAQIQLEQTNSVSIETVVENPQIEDAQQRNNTESILRTDTNTRDVAFWVETVGVEEIVLQESAFKDVAKEETLPDEEPALEQSPDVTPELKSQEIENDREGPVLEFQPLEFQVPEFEQ